MGLISKLFGTDKVIDAGMRGIDSAILTEQERIELKVELLKAYHPFKLAQRYFMLVTTIPYMLGWVTCFVMTAFNLDAAQEMELLKGDLGVIVLAICIFYFGGGTLDSLKRK